MIKIDEFTISLHCGYDRSIVDNQMGLLKPLEEKYKVHWNNRIDRHPGMYPSFSELVNHAVATSPTEWIILMNDRLFPTVDEVEKTLNLLENGYATVYIFNSAFMAFSKELIRTIGWFDEEFYLGGWEDRDWVYRHKYNDLCIYESLEGNYDMHCKVYPKSPLNGPPGCDESEPRWSRKYSHLGDRVIKNCPEPKYDKWDSMLGERRDDIRNSWKKWDDSVLGYMYNQVDRPGSGPSASSMFGNRPIVKGY